MMRTEPTALAYEAAQDVLLRVTDDMRVTLRRWAADRLVADGMRSFGAADVTHTLLDQVRRFGVPMVPSMRRAYAEAGVAVPRHV